MSNVRPEPACRPKTTNVGIRKTANTRKPPANPTALAAIARAPPRRAESHANAACASKQRPRHVNLQHPADRGPHQRERQRLGHLAEAKCRNGLEEAEEEHECRREQVRGIDDVGRKLERPRQRHQPAPDQPRRQRGEANGDVPRERGERRHRDEVEQDVRRFRHRDDVEGNADEQALQGAGDFAAASRRRPPRNTARRRSRSTADPTGRSAFRPRRTARSTARTEDESRKSPRGRPPT